MKKLKKIERKFYELIGIKFFQKMVFQFTYICLLPFSLKESKEERWHDLRKSKSNYAIGKIESVQDIKNFRKMLLLNFCIHFPSFLICLPSIIEGMLHLSETITSPLFIGVVIFNTVNVYCILLQRYNWIRIQEMVEKYQPIEEEKKVKLVQKLKYQDSLVKEHTYCLYDYYQDVVKDVTIDELVENASLEQLKIYRKNLNQFQKKMTEGEPLETSYPIPILEEGKRLRLYF